MARENINTGGSANDGTGDSLRTAGVKINNNFTELYTSLSQKNIGLGSMWYSEMVCSYDFIISSSVSNGELWNNT